MNVRRAAGVMPIALFALTAVFLTAALGGCRGAAAPVLSSGSSPGCAPSRQYVAVGGTAGFNALTQPEFTTALLATARVRLYEHANAVGAAIADSPASNPYAILNAIESVFSGTGPGEAELGYVGAEYFTLPPTSYPAYYQYLYVVSGLNPSDANVNLPVRPRSIRYDPGNVRSWKRWVEAARTVGIVTMAPIVAPNAAWRAHSRKYPPKRAQYYDFTSAFYDLARFQALYGRAIAFDTPPHFFLQGGSGAGYQRFIEQAIRWGNERRIRTTVLISPYPNRRAFLRDTKEFVAVLGAHDAIPSEWSVDDYENTNANDAPAMGPDTRANTVTNVALWLALHAPVREPHGSLMVNCSGS